MTKKFEWGKVNKCGVIGCNKQIDWGEFTSYLACENHHNLRWGLCEACQKEKTAHTVYYDIYHGDDNAKQALKGVKEGPEFQKEIIEKFFLMEHISTSLRQKLNAAYQKCQEGGKNIPELERLTREYWEKKLNCASDLVREKGGQQTNVYECNLCDNCGDEVNVCQQKLKNDYQSNVLNKLVAFGPETSAQIEKEIGIDKAARIAIETTYDNKKKTDNRQAWTRWRFMDKLSFLNYKKTAKHIQDKKIFFQKLKKYFQDNQIQQIVEGGGDIYIIWYANGDIKEKSSSQLTEWSKLRTFFFNTSQKCLSLHEINKTLTDLEQEPNPNDKEEEMTTNENENQNPLSDLEKELIKSFFHKYKIKKISLHNGELVITHNNNKIISNTNNNFGYQLIKDSLSKIDKNELTAQELGLNSENISPDNAPTVNKYYWLIGGVTLGIIIVGILVFIWRQKKPKNK